MGPADLFKAKKRELARGLPKLTKYKVKRMGSSVTYNPQIKNRDSARRLYTGVQDYCIMLLYNPNGQNKREKRKEKLKMERMFCYK